MTPPTSASPASPPPRPRRLPRRPARRYRRPVRRILIVGSAGAGKSTLAREIARRLGLPLIHLDRHYWRPGWVASGDARFRADVAALAARPAWVMDGNYGGTLDLRLPRADLLVLCDPPPAALPRPGAPPPLDPPRHVPPGPPRRLPRADRPGVPPLRLALSPALPSKLSSPRSPRSPPNCRWSASAPARTCATGWPPSPPPEIRAARSSRPIGQTRPVAPSPVRVAAAVALGDASADPPAAGPAQRSATPVAPPAPPAAGRAGTPTGPGLAVHQGGAERAEHVHRRAGQSARPRARRGRGSRPTATAAQRAAFWAPEAVPRTVLSRPTVRIGSQTRASEGADAGAGDGQAGGPVPAEQAGQERRCRHRSGELGDEVAGDPAPREVPPQAKARVTDGFRWAPDTAPIEDDRGEHHPGATTAAVRLTGSPPRRWLTTPPTPAPGRRCRAKEFAEEPPPARSARCRRRSRRRWPPWPHRTTLGRAGGRGTGHRRSARAGKPRRGCERLAPCQDRRR